MRTGKNTTAQDGEIEEAVAAALASVERREAAAAPEERPGAPIEIEVEKPAAPPGADAAAVAGPAATPIAAPAAAAPTIEEIDELRDRLLRMAADFDNYRKRSRREIEEARRYGVDALLHDIVPVADNLERALLHSQEDKSPVVEGVRMVTRQLTEVLKGHGVTGFSSVGELFDPERHEAVTQRESGDQAAGTVLEELQKGYMLHDRLLRPARVVVAVPQEQSDNATSDSPEPTLESKPG